MHLYLRRSDAFTLLEVALAIGILAFGITAVVTVYMVSLKWAESIRVDLTALQTGRVVLFDAGIISDKDGTPSGLSNRDELSKGYVNDYFVVRSYDKSKAIALPPGMGDYVQVRVQVFYGGTDADGKLAHEVFCSQIIPKSYLP